jgi:site-specific DNA-cytosine methylase
MAKPWADAGYTVYTYDLQDGQDINEFNAENLLEQHGNDNIMVVLSQPPCTDFASSGARWWADKDADGRTEASKELVRQVLRTVELFRPGVWMLENPVGRIASQTKLPEPTAAFDPWHFGDDYTKRTQFFGRFNPDMPQAPVFPARGSLIHKMSSSAQKERSDTPEGVAYSFFMANNYVGMGPAGRLAAEFAGVERDLFEAALAAGKTERAIRSDIEDSYYESDLDTVRDTLRDMAPAPPPAAKPAKAKPAPKPAPKPPEKPAVTERNVVELRKRVSVLKSLLKCVTS